MKSKLLLKLKFTAPLMMVLLTLPLMADVDHQIWNKLVQKHVDEQGFVDYPGFIEDRAQLQQYLDQLSEHPPGDNTSRNEKLAYWINAYNAFTVKLIVDNYPVNSIQDLQPTIKIPFVNDIWHKQFFEIGGEDMSLHHIEHNILRPEFNEPLIHFGINCASFSCPKLNNEAYFPDKLEEQLTAQARDFINDETKNKISPDRIVISKIFRWFTGDFTENGTLIDFLNQYSEVEINEGAEIDYMDYDWSLNEKEQS